MVISCFDFLFILFIKVNHNFGNGWFLFVPEFAPCSDCLGKLQVWYVISEVIIIQTGHFFHEKQLIVFNLSLQFLICPSVFFFPYYLILELHFCT